MTDYIITTFPKSNFNAEKTTDYPMICAQIKAMSESTPYLVSNLSNVAALLYNSIDNINWAGFYILQNKKLVLGPFQGKPACTEIAVGKGVCGSAVDKDRTIVVQNVHEFEGHIACDDASNSEIVIPLRISGRIIGALDIDSPILDRFSEEDRIGMEMLAHTVEAVIERSRQLDFWT